MTRAKDPRATQRGQANEGEGNRTAARNYNREQRAFVKSGQVKQGAQKAEEALSGPERDKLREAERIGESKARS